MSQLDVLLAVAGFVVTALVVAGMILITPRGTVDVSGDTTDALGAERSRADGTRHLQTAVRPADGRVGR
jgi:hypothetical protein